MKKRFIVLSSLITILLASFPLVIFADEVAQDSSNLHTISDGVLLDQYFYDNYDPIPYLESTGSQNINTSINANNNIKVSMKFSVSNIRDNLNFFMGTYEDGVGNYTAYLSGNNPETKVLALLFRSSNIIVPVSEYYIHDLVFDGNDAYLDNGHISVTGDYSFSYPICIFGRNSNGSVTGTSCMKLYSFSIYDYSANDGEGAYLRYYYPAKAKTSGVLGLYDAVSKTFVTTGSSTPFSNPTDDKVLNFQIGDFITSGLGWIDDIFDFVIATPIILFFFAVALAGSVYRWARRVVHF